MSSVTLPIVAALTCVYLAVVRSQRYQSINKIHEKYAKEHQLSVPPPLTRRTLRDSSSSSDEGVAPTREELPMTPTEAQSILLNVLTLEMPYVSNKALEFALFKTYGISTIAKLLMQTTEFKEKKTAGRRYSDTGLLIFTFLAFPIEGPNSGSKSSSSDLLDPRSALSVARINYLHGRYGNKISNDDLLYTLSTFILEPAVWAKQFEWRCLTPLEEMSFFVFFSEIGRRMGIKEIPEELQQLIDWAENYEKENMLPAEECRDIASATTSLLLFNAPAFLHPFGVKVISTLLYDRLRESIMLPRPPAILYSVVKGSLYCRAFAIRNFFLPRSQLVSVIDVAGKPAFPEGYVRESSMNSENMEEKNAGEKYAPRMHPTYFVNEPWYAPRATGFKSAVNTILLHLGILRSDQIAGKLKPEGYRLEEMGPTKFEGKGLEEIRKLAEEIQGSPLEGIYSVGGASSSSCPFARNL